MERENQIKRLLEHSFFQGLRPLEIKALFSAGDIRAFESGQVLFNEGAPSDGLFFVLSGVFEVRLESKDFPLAHIKDGEVIGEVGLLSRGPRSARVEAVTESFVWHLSREVFEGLISRGDALAGGLLKGMADDLCRRFREGVYEGASLMGELAPRTAARIHNQDDEWELS